LFEIFDVTANAYFNVVSQRHEVEAPADVIQTLPPQIQGEMIIKTIDTRNLPVGSKHQLNDLMLKEEKVLDAENLLKDSESGKLYDLKRTIYSLKSAPLLIIYLPKVATVKDRVVSYPAERLPTEEGPELMLVSVILHDNAHYFSYIRCDDGWYLYNDLFAEKRLRKVTRGDLSENRAYTDICRKLVYCVYMPDVSLPEDVKPIVPTP
jgi:hypothetical protein